MGANRSFLLIPNHSVAIEGGQIRMESAEADMLAHIRQAFTTVSLAAFVAAPQNSSLSGSVDRETLHLHGLNLLKHSASGKLLNYLYATLRFPFILPRQDFVYIFCPGYCGLIASFWCRVLQKPYGLYVRGTWLDAKAQTPPWWGRMFSGARFMIATGEAFRRRLQEYGNNVMNEVPLTALKPGQVKSLSEQTARPANNLLFAGRLNASKGILDVVRAIALLKQEGYHVRVQVAGGGTAAEIEALQTLAQDLGVAEDVLFLGHIAPARLAEAYESCGVFVFPSYYAEGFPRVLYEAMMYSTAIVTCKMPGTEGFLMDGQNCLYCRPADPASLASCLRRLLEEQELGKQLGRNARADVVRLYDSFLDESHAHQLLRSVG